VIYFKLLSWHLSGRTDKNSENPQESRYTGRHSKRIRMKYKSRTCSGRTDTYSDIREGKVKLSLCLTKYHAMTTFPVLN